MAVLNYDSRLAIVGRGPAVVLVPGMDGTGRLFYRQVPSLAREFTVATFALRDGARRMGELVEDLRGVVDTASPEEHRAVVVGESFGGAVSLSFALAYPERVAALVILNSFPYFAPQYRLRAAIAALRSVPWGTMAIVRRATAFRMHSRHTHRREVRRFLQLSADISREGYLGRLDILRRYDVREQLADIAVPTLFLAADLDRLVPSVKQARLMASLVPGARLRVLEGHGHVCLIAPDLDLRQILSDWLGDVSVGRAGPVENAG